MATFTVFGEDVVNNGNVNSNSNGGQDSEGFIQVSGGQQIFPDGSIVVFEVDQVNSVGEIDGDSGFISITVYEDSAAFADGTALYTYGPQNPGQTADVQSSVDGLGDNYIRFNANVLVSSDSGAPSLSSLFVSPNSNIANQTGSTTFDHHTDIDLNDDGTVDLSSLEDGNGDFNLGTSVVICFAQGTLIETYLGQKPVESLAIGDLVCTIDNGSKPIRWIGKRTLHTTELSKNLHLRPIRIKEGALAEHVPSQDLLVSPQHRIFVKSKVAERMFATDEVLIPAKHLLGFPGVEVAQDITAVTYFHVMCDGHEVIKANDALTETLYTGTEALKSMSPTAREEIKEIFGELPYLNRDLVRHSPKGKQSKKLVDRHTKNGKPLLYEANV